MITAATKRRSASLLIAVCIAMGIGHAQDLRPRAYVITPVHSNAVILSYSFSDGSVFFGSAVPVTIDSGRYSVPSFTYYHSLSFFKRSANFTATLPYVVGHFRGTVSGNERKVYRSGMADSIYRFSVNLIGGPALSPQDFVRWRQKTLLGVSITVVAPTGQYYSSHLINPGRNRWSFKPEVGFSRRWGNWILDAYGAVWLFTTNTDFLSTSPSSQSRNTQEQDPMGVIEMHLSYDVSPRLWASLDANYWYGGGTTVNNVVKIGTLQANSRVGGTVSIPITKHQSVKFSYSDGARTRFGGTFRTFALGWQFNWLGRPN